MPKEPVTYVIYIISKSCQVAALEVVIPPQISDKFSTKDISVGEGGQAKFFCSAAGHPTPTITWRRQPEGRKVISSQTMGDNKKGMNIFATEVECSQG